MLTLMSHAMPATLELQSQTAVGTQHRVSTPTCSSSFSSRGIVLVKASPPDRVWGIGLSAADEKTRAPLRWRGLNLLGFALMNARETLSASMASEGQ